VARSLVVLTVLSALVFFAGLILWLAGPMPERPAAATPVDPVAVADAAPPPRVLPPAPAGMVLVTRPDGSPWFFIDAVPVSVRDFTAQRKKKKERSTSPAPATGVPYGDAAAWAAQRNRRLPTVTEWEAARNTAGFQPAGPGLWEWVDDGAAGPATAPRAVRQLDGGTMRAGTRAPNAAGDVTFRLATDAPK
jgi:hypothetical protein